MSKWVSRLLIGLAFVTQMLVMLPSGSQYCYEGRCGDYYWGVHEHDGIWHLALANVAFSKGWPLRMPTYAGEKLTGYNWLIDLPIYALSKIGISPALTYFKIMPLLWFVLMIWTWKRFANRYMGKKESYWQWLLFLLFFGSSFSFIFTLWHSGTLNGNSSLIAMQAPMMLINLQFAYTLPLLSAVATSLLENKKSMRTEIGFMVAVFLGFGLKFYGGAIILALIGINSLIHKNWKRILLNTAVALLAVIVFYQPKIGGESVMSFKPLATVFPIIEEKALFYFPTLATARYSPQIFKQLIAAIVAIIVFLVFNFGTRLIGLLRVNRLNKFEWSVLLTVFAAIMANMFFVQRGEWWNTVQFLYYGFVLINILAAKQLVDWSRGWHDLKRFLVMGAVVAVAAPGLIDTMRVFAKFPPGSYVSEQEKIVLAELKKQPDGIVLALLLTRSEAGLPYSPSPLYYRYESAYVAAYSGKATYFNDTVQSRLVGIEYQEREQMVKTGDCRVLEQVKYIYVAGDKAQIKPWEECSHKLDLIATSTDAMLYEVR